MNKIELPKKDREEWLKALRSGKYRQSTGVLYNNMDDGFCCLGVFCHLKGVEESKFQNYGMPVSLIEEENLDIDMPSLFKENTIMQSLTLSDKSTVTVTTAWKKEKEIVKSKLTESNFTNFLASLNDEGFSFEKIADVIEETTVGV